MIPILFSWSNKNAVGQSRTQLVKFARYPPQPFTLGGIPGLQLAFATSDGVVACFCAASIGAAFSGDVASYGAS